ncbi:hypothetical protein BGZ72_008926 [Mortierella alpina]|nr:hypothetical protein BGZ72_008926 [Mortierella alpina]
MKANVPSEFYNITYDGLSSLTLAPPSVQKSTELPTLPHQQSQLMQLNPTVKSLTLKHHFSPFSKAFWDAVGTWETPRSLHLSEIMVAPDAADSFWRACSRFHDLEIDQVGVQLSTALLGFEFSQVRFLALEDGRHPSMFLQLESQMDLLCHAPGLQRLDWRVLWSNLELEGFQQLLDRKNVMFPELRRLRVYGSFFTDEKIASILKHAPRFHKPSSSGNHVVLPEIASVCSNVHLGR